MSPMRHQPPHYSIFLAHTRQAQRITEGLWSRRGCKEWHKHREDVAATGEGGKVKHTTLDVFIWFSAQTSTHGPKARAA